MDSGQRRLRNNGTFTVVAGGPVFFISMGSYFYDLPNSLLLVIETVLFINLKICGRFWGKIEEGGRNRPEKRTLRRTRERWRIACLFPVLVYEFVIVYVSVCMCAVFYHWLPVSRKNDDHSC